MVGILKRNWREYCGTLRPLHAERQQESGPEVYNKSDRVFVPAESWVKLSEDVNRNKRECGRMVIFLTFLKLT